jgi:hypothetical protein
LFDVLVAQGSTLYWRPVLKKALDHELASVTLDAPEVLGGLVNQLVGSRSREVLELSQRPDLHAGGFLGCRSLLAKWRDRCGFVLKERIHPSSSALHIFEFEITHFNLT